NLNPSRIAIRRAVQKAVHFDVQSCLTSAEGLAQTDSSRQEGIGEALTERRELRPLIGVHDLGRAEAVGRLVQRFDAEAGFQRVGDAPSQHFPGVTCQSITATK
ncbi:MAG: hypothetical protein ACU0DE_03185, partial [Paracoccus sp. (in: a-proteobacteria)]|uniref:hypothetical protein n=1 Tax=Paracoccus sp. TaxID=267 RepID=UPI0040582DFD